MTTKYRPSRMRLNAVEKLTWDDLREGVDIDTDINELESSGGDARLVYNGRNSLTAQKRASYMLEGYSGTMFGEGDFEITYDFSTGIRRNIFTSKTGKATKYGRDGMSFRILYEYLCATYGGGTYFIDTYFERFFPASQAYQKYLQLKEDIQVNIDNDVKAMRQSGPENMQNRGKLRRFVEAEAGRYLRGEKGRFTSVADTSKAVEDFLSSALSGGAWSKLLTGRRKQIELELKELSEQIRLDIIANLRAGNLTRQASKGTLRRRYFIPEMSGEKALFYASGQLINDMKIYVQLDSGGWQNGKSAPLMGRGRGGYKVVGGAL